jgi:hypothetical protein
LDAIDNIARDGGDKEDFKPSRLKSLLFSFYNCNDLKTIKIRMNYSYIELLPYKYVCILSKLASGLLFISFFMRI